MFVVLPWDSVGRVSFRRALKIGRLVGVVPASFSKRVGDPLIESCSLGPGSLPYELCNSCVNARPPPTRIGQLTVIAASSILVVC